MAQSDPWLVGVAVRQLLGECTPPAGDRAKLQLSIHYAAGVHKLSLLAGSTCFTAADLIGSARMQGATPPSRAVKALFLARTALERVKARLDILNPREGGCRVLIEVPDVRGAAS